MATPARHLCRTLFQVSRQTPLKRKCQHQVAAARRQFAFVPRRPLSMTGARRSPDEPAKPKPVSRTEPVDEELDDSDELERPDEYLTPNTMLTVDDLDPSERADFDMLSKADQEEFLALQNHYAAVFESAQVEDDALDQVVTKVDRKIESTTERLDFPEHTLKNAEIGYWAEDEQDEFGMVEEEEEWDDSAITSVAHSELEVHREVREYTRVIAWDMPLLNQYAKPFRPPTEATPLRFRYTTYMGEVHPAAKKVVVQFCTQDLPNLTEAQRTKLIKLVGPRYNPDTDAVKMSCEKFEAAAQNKRYLGDLVNKLLDEARNGTDKFEDIPLDFRHHKSKKQVAFPEEWKLKPSRVHQLLSQRQEQKLLEMSETPVADGAATVGSFVHQTLGGRISSPPRTL